MAFWPTVRVCYASIAKYLSGLIFALYPQNLWITLWNVWDKLQEPQANMTWLLQCLNISQSRKTLFIRTLSKIGHFLVAAWPSFIMFRRA